MQFMFPTCNRITLGFVSFDCQLLHTWNGYLMSNNFDLDTDKESLINDNLLNYPLHQTEKYEGPEVNSTNLPSVTRILGQTRPIESQLQLAAWKKKMIAKLGEEGFRKMQEETLSAGSLCHSAIEKFFTGTPLAGITVKDSGSGLWQSVQPVLKDITGVVSAEKKCIHPYLQYYGYVDCVAEYKGKLCSIDWKTSQKKRYSLDDCYDDPIQVAAYAGAVNCSIDLNRQIYNGLVVKIYHNGEPATPLFMNDFTLEFYWMQWLKRLALYKKFMKENQMLLKE